MNLILWRHAEAEDQATSDLARRLTTRGTKQALAAAKWLKNRIDDDAIFLVSPAARTIQTAEAAVAAAASGSAAIALERVYLPEKQKKTEMLTGTPAEIAAKLVEKLKFEVRVL